MPPKVTGNSTSNNVTGTSKTTKEKDADIVAQRKAAKDERIQREKQREWEIEQEEQKKADEEQAEIDRKADEERKKRTDSNWGKFLKSLIVYLIYTILIGVVGCGFIYLTELTNEEKENVFPTSNEFYDASAIKSDSIEVTKCSDEDTTDLDKPNAIKTIVGSILEDNFPYSLIKKLGDKKPEDIGLIDRLTNWFAITVKASFVYNRTLMKNWLDVFKDNGRSPLSNHAFQIYIGLPFTVLLSLVAFGTGGMSALVGSFKADPKVTIWGMFLMFTWSMSFFMGLVVFLRFVATLLFLPMSQDWKKIAKTMACNVKVLAILFGFFATGAAYESLDSVIAGVMGIVYLVLVIYTMIQYFRKLFL